MESVTRKNMPTFQLYKLSIASGVCFEAAADVEFNLHPGDAVIVKCEHFTDFALVRSISKAPQFEDYDEFSRKRAEQNKGRHLEGNQLPVVQRRATREDRAQIAENDVRCNSIHERTMGLIQARKLSMKLITTHYTYDRKMLLFSFSADGRVDFRELLRDASSAFRARIELRQIGVRDEASAIGGLGTCGRPFCCATFLCAIGSVNVRMAKQQGLSLNPQNISGCCGRLKCCLQYEAESYRDMPDASQKGGVEAEDDRKEPGAFEPDRKGHDAGVSDGLRPLPVSSQKPKEVERLRGEGDGGNDRRRFLHHRNSHPHRMENNGRRSDGGPARQGQGGRI